MLLLLLLLVMMVVWWWWCGVDAWKRLSMKEMPLMVMYYSFVDSDLLDVPKGVALMVHEC
jgi:hypothetical protein